MEKHMGLEFKIRGIFLMNINLFLEYDSDVFKDSIYRASQKY